MSTNSLRNAIPRKAHKERAQPKGRKKLGPLEKHKDYVVRAENHHTKQAILQKLKEKASFRNPDEFYFNMSNTKTVGGVHKPESKANKYTQDELKLMKTQDIGYILQKLLSEKNKIEKLTGILHSLHERRSNGHVYFAEDREEAKEMQMKTLEARELPTFDGLPKSLKRKTDSSYKELEARRSRLQQLEKLFMEMSMQKELQKSGRKRKLREDEIVCPTTGPVYKWRSDRKR